MSSLFGLIGNCLAVYLSWSVNASLGWCIVHGILGWLYVIYHYIAVV